MFKGMSSDCWATGVKFPKTSLRNMKANILNPPRHSMMPTLISVVRHGDIWESSPLVEHGGCETRDSAPHFVGHISYSVQN